MLGHCGIDRLIGSIRLKYFLPNAYTFLKQYVLACETCQKTKAYIHGHKAPISELPTEEIGQLWFSDIHGALPMAQKSKAKYVIVFVEKVSLWTEFKALVDCSASEVIQAFTELVVSRWGSPRSLHLYSDNGSAYIAKLTALFCKTFAVTQIFVPPYRPQANQPAEILGALINRSLRTLAMEQTNWDESLAMIAYSYRSTVTVGRNLSPFEILHGRPMMLEIDWKLLSDTTTTPTEYVNELKPKLRALQLVALHNAQSNADRQRKPVNQEAVEPTFKIGQKVLIYDPTTKIHESTKLKIRYKGPYEILKEVAKYRYILQDLVSGKSTQRPVHADRLRPFYELADDERIRGIATDVCLAEVTTKHRRLKIRVTVADITTSQCDIVVNMISTQLGLLFGSARNILRCLHADITQTCHEFIQTGCFDQPFETKATGLKEPIKYILHIVAAESKTSDDTPILVDEETLRNRIVNCLLAADRLPDIKSIAIPFPDMHRVLLDRWAICQNLAKAAIEFDERSKQLPGSLETIEFVNVTLCIADSMCIITKQLFSAELSSLADGDSKGQQDNQPQVNLQAQSQDTAEMDQASSEWFPIKKLLKMQMRKRKEFFLVQWESEDAPSWEPRQNVTDEAVREFFAEQRKKRNKKRR